MGAEHLVKYQFTKGHKGKKNAQRYKNPRTKNPIKVDKVSLSREIRNYLEKNPDTKKHLAELLVKMALGEVSKEQAEILNRVRSVEAFKELFNRIDGPLIKRQTNIIRSDKTVILHDGPAIQLDVGEKDEGDDRIIDVTPE